MGTRRRSEEPTGKRTPPRDARPRLPEYDPNAKPISEVAEEIAAEIPDSEWRRLPTDLAKNLHHYIHGGPKDDVE